MRNILLGILDMLKRLIIFALKMLSVVLMMIAMCLLADADFIRAAISFAVGLGLYLITKDDD